MNKDQESGYLKYGDEIIITFNQTELEKIKLGYVHANGFGDSSLYLC
jgi:hypothetical protein